MLYFLVSWLVHLTPVISTYSELHYMEMHYANFAELKKLHLSNRSGFNEIW